MAERLSMVAATAPSAIDLKAAPFVAIRSMPTGSTWPEPLRCPPSGQLFLPRHDLHRSGPPTQNSGEPFFAPARDALTRRLSPTSSLTAATLRVCRCSSGLCRISGVVQNSFGTDCCLVSNQRDTHSTAKASARTSAALTDVLRPICSPSCRDGSQPMTAMRRGRWPRCSNKDNARIGVA